MAHSSKNNLLITRYLTLLKNEFRGYGASSLLSDFVAGITVGAVALPLALAFGAASVSEEYAAIGVSAGLITAIVAGIVSGLLGGGSFQISGPTGAMTVILGGIVSGKYGLSGMFLACFLAGAILLAAGLCRFGRLIRFIPRPVVVGFTSGIAVVIALGQLGNFFGVTLAGETTLDKVIYFFTDTLGKINPYAVLFSVLAVLVMAFYPKKAAKFIPGSLAAIIVVTLVGVFWNPGVRTIGQIPSSLVNTVKLEFSAVTPEMLGDVAGSAVTIALLGMVESLLCGTCAAAMKKEPFDSDVELVAQGIGNMVIPLFGGVPSTAAIARTSVAVKSGGKTRLTAVFQSLFLIACVFVLSGAIGKVPYAALAGVLAVTAFRMNDWATIRSYFKARHAGAILQFSVTCVATVLLDLTYAILIGVGLAFVLLLCDLCRATVDAARDGDTVAFPMSGNCYFAFADTLRAAVEANRAGAKTCIFDFSGVSYADLTVIGAVAELCESLRAAGAAVECVGVSAHVRRAFEHAHADGILQTVN